ncbi:MAG: ParB/RepB/Spo0J family partition protein [Methylocystis sp.]
MTTKTTRTAAKRATTSVAECVIEDVVSDRFTVPLRKLRPDPKNVRRYQSEAGLEELIALIVANGLLQNPVVRPGAKTGQYFVTAGARRLRALNEIAKRKLAIGPQRTLVTRDFPVPVFGLSEGHRPTEVSLAENIGRLNMSIPDQVEGFRRLVEDEGMSPQQVGDNFGVSPMTVRRRVRLAKVSPVIMEAFHAGEIDLRGLEAFALSDDHAAQESVWNSLPSFNRSPHAIRSHLASDKIAATHPVARFVGIEAYDKAGGAITRDLFADDEDDLYLDDKPLIMSLAADKLASHAEVIRAAEGWKWAEHYLSDRETPTGRARLATVQRDLTDAEEAEIDALSMCLEENRETYENGDMPEDDVADYERKRARMDEVIASCESYKSDEMTRAGIVLTLDYKGDVTVRRGLVRREDAHDLAALQRAIGANASEEEQDASDDTVQEIPATLTATECHLTQAVMEDLSKLRTAALAIEMAKRPDVALAALVHALASRVVYGGTSFGYGPLAIELAPKMPNLRCEKDDTDNQAAFDELRKLEEAFAATFPADPAKLWAWCLDASRADLLDALAYLVGRTVNAVAARHEGGSHQAGRLAQASELADALALDMNSYWIPGREFFGRVSKAVAIEAVKAAGGGADAIKAMEKASKADAVSIAVDTLAGKGWLPESLRCKGELITFAEAAD